MNVNVQKVLKIVDYIGEAITFAYTMLIIAVFYMAYFSPTQTVTINVNSFGEGPYELFLVSLTIPAVCFALVRSVMRIRDEFKEIREESVPIRNIMRRLVSINSRTYIVGMCSILIGFILVVVSDIPIIFISAMFIGLGASYIKLQIEEGEERKEQERAEERVEPQQ
ncbi:MAG: hypothetical protein WC525_08975 [Candidatus Thermoplasmatota archaeon]